MSVDYLRVSVTDRCNLRCVYCNPLGDCDFTERKEILRFEEIHRIVRLFVRCGIRKVRLTGGEPLVRKNVVHLVRKLAAIAGIEDLSLTTNGVFLEPMAAELKAAGLQRINVSVDSVERASYKRITGFDVLPKVTSGIYKAIEIGLTPVKINSVIIRDVNVSQIPAIAQMSVYLPVTVRFIEYCPTSKHTKAANNYVPNSEVREIIEHKFGPLSVVLAGGINGPALYFKAKNSAGAIGFISGRSSMFCEPCNRLRLTSDGKVKPCLYSANSYDLKKLIRDGASDKQLLVLLNRIIAEKHRYTKLNSFTEEFSMYKVGG
jgi:cyclic pyranopterin phosphate synthase